MSESLKCFIIQPFDGGQFDKRYQDIIKPTIESLGLESYRVDEDYNSSIPINDIEDAISAKKPVIITRQFCLIIS